MVWFRVYSEIKDDPKMLCLSDRQFRLWVSLLAMASESDERGLIGPFPPIGLAAALRCRPDELTEILDVFESLDMIQRQDDGAILVSHFLDRQYDYPSDQPEATRERKRKERDRDTPVTPCPVTSESGECHEPVTNCHEVDKTRVEEIRVDTGASPSALRAPDSTPVVIPESEPEPQVPAEPEPEKPRRLPAHAEQFSALCEACQIELDALKGNKSARGEVNAAARDTANYTREQIVWVAAEMRRKWPKCEVTPSSIAKHAPRFLGAQARAGPNGSAVEHDAWGREIKTPWRDAAAEETQARAELSESWQQATTLPKTPREWQEYHEARKRGEMWRAPPAP